MAINIKNYIREAIKNGPTAVDSRPGSVWSDLVGNPLGHILEEFDATQTNILNNISLQNIDQVSEDILDKMAANFLVERNIGAYSYGEVKLYYRAPIEVTVPRGTRFSDNAGSKIYETTADYTISKGAMALNRDQYPLYNSAPIGIKSVEKGTDYNAEVFEINTNVSFSGTPVKIENPNPVIGGTASESNSEFYERIKDNILGPNISSVSGIKRTIKNQYPGIIDIEVVGSPDPRMTRDLSLLAEALENFKREDFYQVYPGQTGNAFAKDHKALYGDFIDLDESAAIKLPSPTGFTKEFELAMYEGLMLEDDLAFAESRVQTIAQEFFNEETVISGNVLDTLNTVSGIWEIHDSRNPNGMLFYPDEVRVEDNVLKVGKYVDLSQQDLPVNLPYSTLEGLFNMLVTAVEVENSSDVDIDDEVDIQG